MDLKCKINLKIFGIHFVFIQNLCLGSFLVSSKTSGPGPEKLLTYPRS